MRGFRKESAFRRTYLRILEQIKDAGRVLKVLGVRDGKFLRECASEKPTIKRETKIPTGRTSSAHHRRGQDEVVQQRGRPETTREIRPMDLPACRTSSSNGQATVWGV